MKLITKEIEEKFKKFPLGSQDGKLGDAEVVVKYFNPTGSGTWIITEGEKQKDGDYLMFGYCDLFTDSDCAEFGYVLLSELENIKLPFGLGIERDLYIKEHAKLIDVMRSSGLTPPDFLISEKDTLKESEVVL